MFTYRIPLGITLLVIAACHAKAESDALHTVIDSAVDDPNTPFQLDVFCTDAQSKRVLTVFRGAIAVWNEKRQVTLQAHERRALLQLLLGAGFADFQDRYGGQRKDDKQEAPLRIICSVSIKIAGYEKASVQLFDGEQSPDLLGLANALLDSIEPRAADGVVAQSLEEGLLKLADGEIAPEVLELRVLRLPEDRTVANGYILRIKGGEISRQPYAPGEFVGDIDAGPIDDCGMSELVAALNSGRIWATPRNLRFDGIAELDVAVLGSRYSVSARSSFLSAEADTQARFERMIERLERLPSECGNDL